MGEPLKIRTTRAEKYPRIDNWKAYNETMDRICSKTPRRPGKTRYRFVDGKFVAEDDLRAGKADGE